MDHSKKPANTQPSSETTTERVRLSHGEGLRIAQAIATTQEDLFLNALNKIRPFFPNISIKQAKSAWQNYKHLCGSTPLENKRKRKLSTPLKPSKFNLNTSPKTASLETNEDAAMFALASIASGQCNSIEAAAALLVKAKRIQDSDMDAWIRKTQKWVSDEKARLFQKDKSPNLNL